MLCGDKNVMSATSVFYRDIRKKQDEKFSLQELLLYAFFNGAWNVFYKIRVTLTRKLSSFLIFPLFTKLMLF